MRILVVGGTGFIGHFVSRQLVAEGHQVTVMHRGKRDLRQRVPGADPLISSQPLSSATALASALERRPDRVIHMVAMTEADAKAASQVFAGKVDRLAFASSGDVYLAYGRFTKFEPGPIEPMPLTAEASPIRTRYYPYRTFETPESSIAYHYEKICVERVLMGTPNLRAVCLRLPKVYGNENNRFETMYRFANYPRWRWTHGYVENVAAAIALAVLHPMVQARVYNVGEQETPTVAERLARLPPATTEPVPGDGYNFDQDIVYDTEPIRRDLGYREPIQWEDALNKTLAPPA
jgi:nucleoside-diphosphate-sugar epimerase